MKQLKPGDKVFLVKCCKYHPIAEYREVLKVGTKYFYVHSGYSDPIRFFRNDWQQAKNYSAKYRLFESKEAYESESQRQELLHKVRASLNSYRGGDTLSLSQLTNIDKIINDDHNC